MTTPAKPLAAVHARERSAAGARHVDVAAAVDGAVVFSASRPVSSSFDVLSTLVEAITAAWRHERGGMVLYVGDATIRRLLADTAAARPGLDVRSVVTGPGMRAAWEAARAAQVFAEPPPAETPEWRARRVYATDASKQARRSLVGIAAVGSTGSVHTGTVRASTVREGEFAALALVLRTLLFSTTAQEADILTDSLAVARAVNLRPGRLCAGYERRCLELLDEVSARGIDVRVSWVRGHDGHALNELADRAAVIARRCGQWEQPPQPLLAQVRADLRDVLASVDPYDFVPAAPLPGAAAAA